MTDDTPDFAALESARAALIAELNRAGWTYYRAMLRYHWQMNWAKDRVPKPPAMETLTRPQLFHLTCLIRDNVREKQ